MPRFVKQTDSFSCGPLALLNAMKWQGRRFSVRRNMPLLRKACHASYRIGTPTCHFRKAAQACGFTRMMSPTLRKIDQALMDGNAVVIQCFYKLDGLPKGHAFLVTDRTDKSFYAVNLYADTRWRPKWWVEWRYFRKLGQGLAAWVVKPRPASARLRAA